MQMDARVRVSPSPLPQDTGGECLASSLTSSHAVVGLRRSTAKHDAQCPRAARGQRLDTDERAAPGGLQANVHTPGMVIATPRTASTALRLEEVIRRATKPFSMGTRCDDEDHHPPSVPFDSDGRRGVSRGDFQEEGSSKRRRVPRGGEFQRRGQDETSDRQGNGGFLDQTRIPQEPRSEGGGGSAVAGAGDLPACRIPSNRAALHQAAPRDRKPSERGGLGVVVHTSQHPFAPAGARANRDEPNRAEPNRTTRISFALSRPAPDCWVPDHGPPLPISLALGTSRPRASTPTPHPSPYQPPTPHKGCHFSGLCWCAFASMASPLLVLDVTAPRHHLPGASAICQSSRPSTYIMPPSPRSRGRDRHRSSEIAADTSWLDLVVMLGVLGYQPGWIRARDGVDMERRRENLRHRHSRPVGVGLCPPSPPASLLSPLCILLWPWEHVAELWLLLVSHVTALCHNNPVPEDRGHDATALSQL
ncbi:hypothetical protein JHW43_008880 [Diplocarpon mali]|nr:hypothetical protein JHW43_008880 [Diplocarpon mali]